MSNQKGNTVILDCYTDEPSGYGVRPYLGIHQLHLSQALRSQGLDHYYLTIDDLRYCSRGILGDSENTDLSTYNRTRNCDDALRILHDAEIIYIVMGCFVDYSYFSSIPPKSDEVYGYLKGTEGRKILFYVLGTVGGISPDYQNSPLSTIIDRVEFGNTYRFVLEGSSSSEGSGLLDPNYDALDRISACETPIIPQLRYPIIAEIETGTGCNTPFCTFCIESVRALKVVFRDPESIIKQIKCLYDSGVRHFRLGRQPDFYHYQKQDVRQMERLLAGIREACPDIEMLHIDNANITSVITKKGTEITKLIVCYCTSGNIAPLGVESFDSRIKRAIRKVGTSEQALKAVEVINEYGQVRGDDGLPTLLPGINLIYGLPGQTEVTHRINLEYLDRILTSEWMTRRLFFRKMTCPAGVSFSGGPTANEEYNTWFNDILERYVMPMQTRVYPIGTVLKDFREIVWKNGDSYLRKLATCSDRVAVRNKKLEPYRSYDIRVTENLGYRLLAGEIFGNVAEDNAHN